MSDTIEYECLTDGCGCRCRSMTSLRNLGLATYSRHIIHPRSTNYIMFCRKHFSDYLHRRGWM